MGHMTMQRLIPVAALLMLAACGQGADSGDAGGEPAAASSCETNDSCAGAGRVPTATWSTRVR